MTDKKTIASKLDNVAERVESSEMKKKLLGTIADMLERKNIDINEIGDIKRVSLYQSMLKDDQGEAQIHDLAAIQFSPKWETGPEWPVIQQGKPVQLQKSNTKPKPPATFKTCVVPLIYRLVTSETKMAYWSQLTTKRLFLSFLG